MKFFEDTAFQIVLTKIIIAVNYYMVELLIIINIIILSMLTIDDHAL